MSYQEKLNAEINAELDGLATRSEPWDARWITHAVCNAHAGGLADGDDADFWRWCTYQEVRDQVRRNINSRAGDRPASDDRQGRLPGYDHLQAYYVVKRQGDDLGVPVHALTDAEIEAKATQYRLMGEACFAHADELDRFRRLRPASAAG